MTADVRRYRKKPVEVEAVQVTRANAVEVAKWCNGRPPPSYSLALYFSADTVLEIETREGIMSADDGDYIIREPFPTSDRRFYPVKPEIFQATYEAVDE